MSLSKKIQETYRGMLFSRYDEKGFLFYFSYKDFEGMKCEPYEFKSNYGVTLRGAFYYRDKKDSERIIIFCHGIDGGHRSYMREIDELTRHGYTVLAYDNTGCMISEGDGAKGYAGSLSDLVSCIDSLKSHPEYANLKISVIGHSWGGFAALNIGAYHPEVTHICSISGFVSVKSIIKQQFPLFLHGFVPGLLAIEREASSKYVDSDAVTALRSTKAKALIIHSADDKTVKARKHYSKLRSRLKDRENTTFLLTKGKGHNPNYTEDAVSYLAESEKKLVEYLRSGKLSSDEEKTAFKQSLDWYRMTAQDPDVWRAIFNFLDS